MRSRVSIPWSALVLPVGLAACRADIAREPQPQPDSLSAVAVSAARIPPLDSIPLPKTDSVRPQPTVVDTAFARRQLTQDSAVQLVVTSRLPERTQQDSISLVAVIRQGLRHPGWPVSGPEPLPGAILPSRRIVAFYGNPLSKRMGILGELPPERMLARLAEVAAEWQAADPGVPVQPALHLVAITAQPNAGKDSLYRQRMDSALIQRVYDWARQHQAILFLDIQAGRSTVQRELPHLLSWLARPDVHLALDPEFYMHGSSAGSRPGSKVGTMDAADVNEAIATLGELVTRHQLPPKVLVIHRFSAGMLRNVDKIRLDPRVQVVNNMDGWGQPWHKFDSYAICQVAEPVQFTGFKLFFRHDTRKGDPLLTPQEVLSLRPRPLYVQYQ